MIHTMENTEKGWALWLGRAFVTHNQPENADDIDLAHQELAHKLREESKTKTGLRTAIAVEDMSIRKW
jgi:hypothetical protein